MLLPDINGADVLGARVELTEAADELTGVEVGRLGTKEPLQDPSQNCNIGIRQEIDQRLKLVVPGRQNPSCLHVAGFGQPRTNGRAAARMFPGHQAVRHEPVDQSHRRRMRQAEGSAQLLDRISPLPASPPGSTWPSI